MKMSASYDSTIRVFGCDAGNYSSLSPALNSVGNTNSLIYSA